MNLRAVCAAALVAGLISSCSAGASPAATTSSPRSTTAEPTSPTKAEPSTTAADTRPGSTSTVTTATASTTPATLTSLPPVPAPLAVAGDSEAHVRAIVDALTDDTIDRGPAVLAAFTGARLPVLLADGTSLTTSGADPLGFPWAIVSSATTLSSPRTRVSLAELASLFALVDPSRPLDTTAVATELLAGLRAAMASPEGASPRFLAQLVAEEARRYRGVELLDPNVGPDQIFVESTVAMMISASAFRAVLELMAERGELPVVPARTGSGGPHGLRRVQADDNPGCDDGQGGWLLWLGSKLATGANLPGFEWRGIYTTLAEFGVARGVVTAEAVDATKAIGKGTAIAGAMLNLALLQAQLSTRYGLAEMDGTGPLIRSKTTLDGSARTITLTIGYGGGDPKAEQARNCILASLAFAGNNAQQALGAAGGVEVDTTGELGFTKNLVTAGTLVLFGPDTFHPTQTADEAGRITIPVQGRGQQHDKSDTDRTVDKQFSLFFEASLDPVTASTIARALADDVLCLGTVATGNVVDAVAECQNAVVDIIKQFHWDLGEYFFPLTDWDNDGYYVNAVVFPYTITGLKCGGVGGTWDLYMESASSEFAFAGIMLAEIDGELLTGPFTFEGEATAGGRAIPITGSGTATFVQNADGIASLEIGGAVFGPRGAGATTAAPFSVPLDRNEQCDGDG